MGGKKKVVSPWLRSTQILLWQAWSTNAGEPWATTGCLAESFEIPKNTIRVRFVAGSGPNSLQFKPFPKHCSAGYISGYGDGKEHEVLMFEGLEGWLRSIEKTHGGWHWVEVEVPA